GFNGRNCATESFYDGGNGCSIHINILPSQVKSYEEASIKCKSLKAKLAILKVNESLPITKQYQQFWTNSTSIWLGGKLTNASWNWADGSQIAGYNTSAMNGVCLSTNINGSWFSENCTKQLGFACEKRGDGVGLCTSSKCKNGGLCFESGCHFHCTCPSGHSGSLCETFSPTNSPGTGLNPLTYIIPIV
uniref:C-type lectin domain-containing protein n=2 Tax=Ciona intestinalis TaxID=7719 RepID=H2Y1M3_CIOIN